MLKLAACIMDRDSGYAILITYQLMDSAPALSAFVSRYAIELTAGPVGQLRINCDPGWVSPVRNTVAPLAT